MSKITLANGSIIEISDSDDEWKYLHSIDGKKSCKYKGDHPFKKVVDDYLSKLLLENK